MSLFGARVDAAVAEYDRYFGSSTQTEYGAGRRRTAMAEAIRAADAVVTVEQIEKAVTDHSRLGDEIDGTYYCACGGGDAGSAFHIAESVLALFRGGVK